MELFRLIIQLLGVIVWPISMLVVLFVFRSQIRERLSHILKAELPGGVKFELGELERSVQESVRAIETVVAPSPLVSTTLSVSADPMLAVMGTRLDIEREVVQLSQFSKWDREPRKLTIAGTIEDLHEEGVVSRITEEQLLEYIRLTNSLVHAPNLDVEQVSRSISIGTMLLAQIRHIRSVQYLLHDFEGHGLWHFHRMHHGEEEKYYFFSAIAATMPGFDYSYDAYCEAARTYNEKESRRADEGDRAPRPIFVPDLREFLEILEHRRCELVRVIRDCKKQGTTEEHKEAVYWTWPQKWGPLGWSSHIVAPFGIREARDELLKTDAAIEHYQRRLAQSSTRDNNKTS